MLTREAMKGLAVVWTAMSIGFSARAETVVIENEAFRLSLGADGRAKSLIVLSNGEECLEPQSDVPMFSVVQERPFNDETKLHYPNTRTVYPANWLRQDGDDLIVGFKGAPYEARVGVVKKADYLAFVLRGFIRKEGDYGAYLNMDLPPAVAFRVVQLPVKPRRNFGEWLNVMWDESAQVAVLGLDAQVEVWHEERAKACLLQADLHKGRKLSGGAVAVVAAADEERFLNAIADIEEDYNLPRGVKSRRSGRLNESIFWTQELKPTNVDEHIRLARKAGFRMMLVYYPSMIDSDGYLKLGDYDWNADYPNGEADLRKVLAKIRAAGITPGFHTLQTHIGMKSRYVTPVADHRLSLTRRFRLSRPLPREGEVSEIHVEENPVDAVMFPTCRVLQFGGELFWYEAYVTNRPYRFIGVRRGAWGTAPAAHPVGERGGTLDLSEYGEAKSCYIDQETSLQDEVAAKIARIIDCGFEFCYFDGSEGVNPPCGINVSLSQLRVAQAVKTPLLFTEGAAKSHFGWHLQSGANAFDIFPPERFKESVVRYPLAEAPEMRKNFTRVDFGWWGFFLPSEKSVGTQADMWEFGTSKAAAWDCPVSFQFLDLKDLKRHPRIDDLFETTRRWEEVRERGLLTDEDRRRLRDPKREFHLYLNERSQYELVEIEMLPTPAQASDARAFVFRRNGRTVLACWHVRGAGQLLLRMTKGVVEELPLSSRRYVESDMSVAEMKAAYAAAVMKGTNE